MTTFWHWETFSRKKVQPDFFGSLPERIIITMRTICDKLESSNDITTLCNLHIYLKENKLLHVFTYKRKYINFRNWSIIFLVEYDEMKSCINRVELANAELLL